MEYISVSEFAEKHGISQRTARNYCGTGKIEGAMLIGKTWSIPSGTELPERKSRKRKPMPLLAALRREKDAKLKGGIYHRTQIDLTYNSNHIEGSRLSHEQTRYIFETNTIGFEGESIRVDDIIETTSHFRCIDFIIDRAEERLTEKFIKELHRMLKANTFLNVLLWVSTASASVSMESSRVRWEIPTASTSGDSTRISPPSSELLSPRSYQRGAFL